VIKVDENTRTGRVRAAWGGRGRRSVATS